MFLKYNSAVHNRSIKIYSNGNIFSLYINNVLSGEYESYRDAINAITTIGDGNATQSKESSKKDQSNKKGKKGKRNSSGHSNSTDSPASSTSEDDKGTVSGVASKRASNAKKVEEIV